MQRKPSSAKFEESVLMYISEKIWDAISVLVATMFSLQNFLSPPPQRVSYIIQLPLDDLGTSFVDRPDHYLSSCPISHLLKPLMSCGSQDSTVQRSCPYKCSQEVWWDALNVVTATIPLVMSGLTPSPKLFLYNMTSSGNVPLM